MKIILVGTDFSKNSDRAFFKACEIAQSMGNRVHLLHVVEPVDEEGSTDPDTEKFYTALTTLSKVKLDAEVQANTRPVEVTCEVKIGPRVQTIGSVASAIDADLIVLGSKPFLTEGTSHLGISHKVALTSTRAVLLVPTVDAA